MINSEQFELIARALPILGNADARLLQEFQNKAFFAHIPEGRDVFIEGDHVDAIALLISGVVRVYKIGETGREITLYRFGNGESCILTANAILSQKNFPAIATVEKEAEAVMIPLRPFGTGSVATTCGANSFLSCSPNGFLLLWQSLRRLPSAAWIPG